MGFRQVEELLDALPQPHTEPLSAADGDQRLGELKAAVVGIRPGIQECREPAQAVAGGDGEQPEARCRDRRHRDHIAEASTSEEQHSEAGGEQYGGGAEIGLRQQERGDAAQQAQRLEQTGERVAQLFLAAYSVAREVDEHENARQLRNLEVEAEEPQPAPAAVDGMAQPGDQHDEQQAESDYQQGDRDALQQVGADAEEQCGTSPAGEHQDELPLEIVERLARLLAGDGHRRGGDHDESEQHDAQHDRDRDHVDVNGAASAAGAGVGHRRAGERAVHAASSFTACVNTEPRCV